MDSVPTAVCTACGATLDPRSAAPCPNCGRTGTKKVDKTIQGRVVVTASVHRASIHTRVAFSWWAIALLILLTVIQPFVSLLLRGLAAIGTGVALGVVGIVVGCFAMVRIREIERHI